MDLQTLHGLGGLIAAIGTLLSGIGALTTAWQKRSERKEQNVKQRTRAETVLWAAGAALVVFAVSILAARAATKNEELTTAAWNAFKAKDYQSAITKCTELIDEFGPAADREESALVQKRAPHVPKGVVSEADKKMAFERGLVNDVGACHFIIGRSAEFQKRNDVAKEAYSRAAKYTYARVWDPDGKFFWPPAEAAQARLDSLK